MTVIKNPTEIALCAPGQEWPEHPMGKSSNNQSQVTFRHKNREISVTKIGLVFDGSIKCDCLTCDCQNVNCGGCFGSSPTTRPLVLECDVIINNPPSHYTDAHFRAFRSLRFTNLFFKDLRDFSTIDRNMCPPLRGAIRAKVKSMVEDINANGGWTVTGWHRCGTTTTQGVGAGEEAMQSHKTVGHIVSLEPSVSAAVDLDTFKENLIDSIQPTIP